MDIESRLKELIGKSYNGYKIFAVNYDKETGITDLWTDNVPSRVCFGKAENAIGFVIAQELEKKTILEPICCSQLPMTKVVGS